MAMRGCLPFPLALLLLTGPGAARGALIAYWPFSEGSGTTTADASGNGHAGTLSGAGTGAAPTWDTANGRFGTALEFNTPSTSIGGGADGSLITVPFNAAFRLNGAFTVSLWWRPDSDFASGFPGAIRIGTQGTTTGSDIGWGLFHNSAEAAFLKRGNVQHGFTSPAVALTVGGWHHLLIAYDGAGNNLAVQDGVARTFSQTWLTATTSANLQIGRMDNFANAGLDDIALFDHALSPGEARSLFTTPVNLGFSYSLAEMSQLWQIHAGGPGSTGSVGGTQWMFTDLLPGAPAAGDSYLNGGLPYVALTANTGVTLVPEPTSAALLAAGLLGLARLRARHAAPR
jgi:hypothetical protein